MGLPLDSNASRHNTIDRTPSMRTTRRLREAPTFRSPTAPQREIHLSHFTVNQCWSIVKASNAPTRTDEGTYDVYVLQDSAGMYLFGNMLVPFGSQTATKEEVSSLFQCAWRTKHEWPKVFLLPDSDPPRSSFAVRAKRNGIPVEVVPESVLAMYINDVQAAFREHFGGEEPGAA
jgi:hypothetical protein